MKKNIPAAVGALALIGVLTAAPAYAAPDRPLAPASVEIKLAPDDSSDPEPKWGALGEEWMDGPKIDCGTRADWASATERAACISQRNAQTKQAQATYKAAKEAWKARRDAREQAAESARRAAQEAPTTAYTPPPSYTAPPTAAPRSNTSDIPWPWVGGGAVALLLGWVLWRRRSLRPAPARGYAGPRPGLRDRALSLLDGLRDRVDLGPRHSGRGYPGESEDYAPHRAYPADDGPFGGYEPVPAYADEQYAPTVPDPEPSARPPRNDGEYTHLDSLFNHDDGGK